MRAKKKKEKTKPKQKTFNIPNYIFWYWIHRSEKTKKQTQK